MTTSPKRVVFAVNDLLVGGVQRLYLDLFRQGFPGWEVHLVVLFQFPRKQEWYDRVPPGVVVHRLDFSGFTDILSWAALWRLLRTVRPHFILSSLFFSNTVLRILAALLRIPAAGVEHNTYREKTRAQIWVDRILALSTYKVVAVSKTVLTFTAAQERIPAEKFVLIHNGLDLQAIDTASGAADPRALRAKLGLLPEQRIVLNVARLTPQKNQKALIEGFVPFRLRHPEYVLVIAGEGSQYAELEETIRAHEASSYVFLVGSQQDLAPYYAASDFFVSSSHIEGFGLAHAEALRTGLPVLTTKTAGPDEMIIEGKNGLFVDAPTASGILSGLECMLSAPFDSRESIAASVERFSIKATAAGYLALFNAATNTLHA